MKLSAKFARQESEEQRLARIARKRISDDRADAICRMLGLDTLRRRRGRAAPPRDRQAETERQIPCPECDQRFRLPMHLGRHLRATHGRKPVAADGATDAA
jgi:uncharacterized C2H2 Zn-finger protein